MGIRYCRRVLNAVEVKHFIYMLWDNSESSGITQCRIRGTSTIHSAKAEIPIPRGESLGENVYINENNEKE